MAFITNSNAKFLEFQVKEEFLEKIYIGDLYKLSLWMLTKKEQQWLAVSRLFYENPDFYLDKVYKKVVRDDNKKWIYVGGAPAYHCNKVCGALNGDFVNYEIPQEIIEKGDAIVDSFRQWWQSQADLLVSDPKRFLEIMSIRWLLRNPPSIKSYEAANSGVKEEKNWSVEDVEKAVDDIVHSMKVFRDHNVELINTYGKRTYVLKKSGIENINDNERCILEKWHEQKEKLKSLLRFYFQLRFNPDLDMSETFLDAIGFEKCSLCHKK